MKSVSFPRSKVLETYYNALESVSETRFVSTRTEDNSAAVPHYILIRMPNGIQDKGDTYQTGVMQIWMFVRDITKGMEDVSLMQEKIDDVLNIFPISHENVHSSDVNLISSGCDGMGFHYTLFHSRFYIYK